MIIKKFWKEMLLVIVLIFVLSYLFELLPPPAKEEIFSPQVMLIGLIVLLLPFFASLSAGFLVSKKSKQLKDSMLVPAIAASIAAILIISFSTITLFTLSDKDWQEQFEKVKEYIPFNMTLEQFKSMTISSSFIGLIFLVIFNFGLGAAGGIVGRWVELRG